MGFRFSYIVPKIQLAADHIKETIFKRDNERTAVELKKCQSGREPADYQDDRACDIDRQYAPKHVRSPYSPTHIYELFEGERAKNLILDLYKLRYLELHSAIITQVNE